MINDKKQAYLIGLVILLAIVGLLLWLGEIILPFLFAIFLAYLLNPLIVKVQKRIKNRSLSISLFLLVFVLLFSGVLLFFGDHFIKDSKRLVSAVEVFSIENQDEISAIKEKITGLVDSVYQRDEIQNYLDSDSLIKKGKEQDLGSALESVYGFFKSDDKVESSPKADTWSIFQMIIYTLIYSLFILYTFPYFESKYEKYFGNWKPQNKILTGVWQDFKRVFTNFFRQRTKIVLINSAIFIIAFSLLDLPGAIIIGILTGILSYATHFHYLSLPLVGIGSWILAVENDHYFILYFGVILLIYFLISVLEETFYFDRIMKSVNSMNPAVVMLSFTLWIFIFGGFIGTIIALPMTQLILIFLDRMILYSRNNNSITNP